MLKRIVHIYMQAYARTNTTFPPLYVFWWSPKRGGPDPKDHSDRFGPEFVKFITRQFKSHVHSILKSRLHTKVYMFGIVENLHNACVIVCIGIFVMLKLTRECAVASFQISIKCNHPSWRRTYLVKKYS